jgi:hypothetical protein
MRHWWNDPLWAAFLNKHRFQAINDEDYQKRGDSKRCNALARLEHRKPAHPDVVSSVGRVDSFFELRPLPQSPIVALQYGKELMGLFVWDGNKYLRNKFTSNKLLAQAIGIGSMFWSQIRVRR